MTKRQGVRAAQRRGFGLIDVLGAIVIIGTAIGATMNWMTSGTMANGETSRAAVGLALAQNVHEYALSLDPGKPTDATETASPRSLVLHLNNQHFDHPIDSKGQTISDPGYLLTRWSIDTTVTSCPASNLSLDRAFASATATDVRRLTVKMKYNNKVAYVVTWMVSPSSPPPAN